MKIQLSEHFTYGKLVRFALPSVIMMIFTSIYGVVDGLFVSNFVGKEPFAAVNLIMPVLMILGTVGFMIGAGGSAIVAKTFGEGKPEKAREYFSMLIYVTLGIGIVLSALGIIFMRPAAAALGATGQMLEDCVIYGRINAGAVTAFMLQQTFQSFMITAEKPQIGLKITVCAGVTNMALDLLFIGFFRWGVAGAALATAASQLVGGGVPLIYFSRKNSSILRLTKAGFYPRILLKTCTNGSSELMTNISMSLVNMLYNFQLMRFAGEDGVAAYGVIMYAGFIFAAIFIGYSIGTAPIVGFNFGAANHAELQNLFKKSLFIIGVCGLAITSIAVTLAPPLAKVFVGYDRELCDLTSKGFTVYSLSFLICGFNIYGSSFFTALNNGLVSAVISFLRTFVFQIAAVLILPEMWGVDGVWVAVASAEIPALMVTVAFMLTMRKRYRYA